jgi:hypothetical protein
MAARKRYPLGSSRAVACPSSTRYLEVGTDGFLLPRARRHMDAKGTAALTYKVVTDVLVHVKTLITTRVVFVCDTVF